MEASLQTARRAQRFRAVIQWVLWSLLGSAAFGNPCVICFDNNEESIHVDVCDPCMLKYLRQKIDEGFLDIPDPLRVRAKGAHSSSVPMLFLALDAVHGFLASRDQDYVKRLDRNQQRFERIRKGGVPCPCDHPCEGILIKPKRSITRCDQCGHHYQPLNFKAIVGAEVRACQHCSGPITKDGGCDHIQCGHCKFDVNWSECSPSPGPLPAPTCCILQ